MHPFLPNHAGKNSNKPKDEIREGVPELPGQTVGQSGLLTRGRDDKFDPCAVNVTWIMTVEEAEQLERIGTGVGKDEVQHGFIIAYDPQLDLFVKGYLWEDEEVRGVLHLEQGYYCVVSTPAASKARVMWFS